MTDTDAAQWDIDTGVGLTALGVAAGRAMETHREGGLVSDPFAEEFVAAAHPPVPLPTRLDAIGDTDIPWAAMSTYMGVRSRFFDDYLTTAAAAGAIQVVLLAVGLDSRAHRLPWPAGTTVYELDVPKVLAFKDRVLADRHATPRAERRTVAVDLRRRWDRPLQRAGFDSSRSSVWLAEGLLPFLPNAAKEQLLSIIDELAAPGSRIALESIQDLSTLRHDPRFEQMWVRVSSLLGLNLTAMWPDEENFDVAGWLSEHGWAVTTVHATEMAEHYHRSLDDGPMQSNLFITAHR